MLPTTGGTFGQVSSCSQLFQFGPKTKGLPVNGSGLRTAIEDSKILGLSVIVAVASLWHRHTLQTQRHVNSM